MGAVLEQKHGNVWHPIEYFLKSLSDTGSRYSATEYEIVVCTIAIEHWHLYLVCRAFDVLMDHAPN